MRIVAAVLADLEHKLPIPGQPGMVFPTEGRPIDIDDPFWLSLVTDGSLKVVEPGHAPAPAEASYSVVDGDPDQTH